MSDLIPEKTYPLNANIKEIIAACSVLLRSIYNTKLPQLNKAGKIIANILFLIKYIGLLNDVNITGIIKYTNPIDAINNEYSLEIKSFVIFIFIPINIPTISTKKPININSIFFIGFSARSFQVNIFLKNI
jgi:hypothetical protein